MSGNNEEEEKEPVDTVVDLSKIQIKEIDESKFNRNNEYDFLLPVSKTPIKFKLLTRIVFELYDCKYRNHQLHHSRTQCNVLCLRSFHCQ